ncbi:maltokinase [Embleya sp. NPDC008237]|uniref:maltokinase N-terminal cap-like domain-containing protein n=1 Tax=Embleya sp. NPDC008237 TaxID=3363978 RepID=UPI0036E3C80C
MTDSTRPHDPTASAVIALLRDWLPQQRWFAGKGRPLRGAGVVHSLEVVSGDPALHHMLLRVEHGGTPEHYQLLLGVRETLPPRLAHALIGRLPNGHSLYDAVHDAELTRWLPERFVAADTVGPLAFHRPGAQAPDPEHVGLVIGAEQSNTSIIFGDDVILKLFRRVVPGVNPDLEVSLALAGAGSRRIPAPIAWFDMPFPDTDAEPTTLGMLQEYLRTGTDGWELAKTSVRDLYAGQEVRGAGPHAHETGGDFAGESFRLGAATAEVHADLARSLPTAVAGRTELAAIARDMEHRLHAAAEAVPDLAPFTDRLREAYQDLETLGRDGHPVPLQRIHGDFHLGQVMRTATRWVLLDFEGEPARPLSERRSLHSPLRDIAAMLRSFDYAARHLLAGGGGFWGRGAPAPHLVRRAEEWATRNREAFCAGYAEAGSFDPHSEPVLLRAFETDKAVYEVMYESGNRPSWLPVPMSAIRRLAERAPQPH